MLLNGDCATRRLGKETIGSDELTFGSGDGMLVFLNPNMPKMLWRQPTVAVLSVALDYFPFVSTVFIELHFFVVYVEVKGFVLAAIWRKFGSA